LPVSIRELDSSSREENITIILGRNIILKIIEKPESKALLEDELVRKFISTKNLCNEKNNSMLADIFEKESKLTGSGLQGYLDNLFKGVWATSAINWNSSILRLPERPKRISARRGLKLKMPDGRFTVDFDDLYLDLIGKVDKEQLQKIDDAILSVNDKIKNEIGLSVLVPYNLLLCPNCNIILSIGEFETATKKCDKCKKEIKRGEADRIYVHRIHDKIKEVWKSNIWFEAYMSGLLRKLDWQTWTNVHVMGSSGILHEIDFLAIKEGIILIGECKTGKVSRNDVFNFCTKANDIKAHRSILALMSELPEPETRDFIKKNPAIINLENICKLEESQILDELNRRL